jgi:aryl-alcohol dehydrogenase-like predicted oxidoreductase
MDPFELVDVGDIGLKVTRLGLGGAPLGTPSPVLADEEAVETNPSRPVSRYALRRHGGLR